MPDKATAGEVKTLLHSWTEDNIVRSQLRLFQEEEILAPVYSTAHRNLQKGLGSRILRREKLFSLLTRYIVIGKANTIQTIVIHAIHRSLEFKVFYQYLTRCRRKFANVTTRSHYARSFKTYRYFFFDPQS